MANLTAHKQAKAHLTAITNDLTTVNAYAHSVDNVDLRPATHPPEDWYNDLEKAIGVAQTNTKVLTDSIGPDIGSNVPKTIINYGNILIATTVDILQVL